MKTEIVMYHYVRKIKSSRYPEIKGLELDEFIKQLDFMKTHYSFVSMNDVIEAFQTKKGLPENAMLLTFDDGYRDHYDNVFPLLVANGIPAVFSIPGRVVRERQVLSVNKIQFILASADINNVKNKLLQKVAYYRGREFEIEDNDILYSKLASPRGYDNAETMFIKRMLQSYLPERLRNTITDELFREMVTDEERAFADELYMTMNQAKEMHSQGMSFAIHGYEHYHFDTLRREQYEPDITKALEVFDGIIDHDRWVFCYPYGDENDELIEFSRAHGCVAGMTCEARTLLIEMDSIFRIPRYDTNDYPPKSEIPRAWIK